MRRVLSFLLGLCLVGLGAYQAIAVELDIYAIMLIVFGVGFMAGWSGSSRSGRSDDWFDSGSDSGSSCGGD
ncbi:hypothetical protein ACJJIF_02340 [Microbulbifer sp. SSSA002]|uniref:hypothetical protein n=1 Tax=Microbulbifer sp. SSSA002 TaxID=3243376 RepID=UPI0040399D7E